MLAGRIHLGKMERSTQRLWASGVWEESLLVRNLGLAGSIVEELAGSMVEELAGAEGSHGLGDLHNDIFS